VLSSRVAKCFIGTMKEQLLWVRTFDTVEELWLAPLEFKAHFNQYWLLQRRGYKTPAVLRTQYEPVGKVAWVLGKTAPRVTCTLRSVNASCMREDEL